MQIATLVLIAVVGILIIATLLFYFAQKVSRPVAWVMRIIAFILLILLILLFMGKLSIPNFTKAPNQTVVSETPESKPITYDEETPPTLKDSPVPEEFKDLYSKNNLPRFEDFPVSEEFKDAPAQVDFSTNAILFEDFKTYYPSGLWQKVITEGIKNGPNFAGHYRIFTMGCGTMCESGIMIDFKTGSIYDLPAAAAASQTEFYNNSSLFITDPHPFEALGAVVYIAQYYIWEDNHFIKIFSTVDK